MAAEIDTQMRAAAGKAQLRARAEGHGAPIVSTMWQGRRVVAVRDRLFVGQWPLFTDFLLHHMWTVLDNGAATPLRTAMPDHPLVAWEAGMWTAPRVAEGGPRASSDPRVAALIRLAYALYLIAHNDRLSPILIKRLRNPKTFRPAALETYVASAFALAGYKIEMGENGNGSSGSVPEAEFIATAPSGKRFSVEAKRKDHWDVQPHDAAAAEEIRRWVRGRVYACAKKKLASPVYWIDLALVGRLSREQLTGVLQSAVAALRGAEVDLLVDGAKPAPAYVFLSSFGVLADGGLNTVVLLLDGFHLKFIDFDGNNLDDALVDRGRHREMRWILTCARTIQTVPHSFDGIPDALLDAALRPVDRMEIGQRLEVPLPDGTIERGTIKLIFPGRETAGVCLIRPDGCEVIVQVPLTPDEQRVAGVLGELAFGQPASNFHVDTDDPLGIYEFFLHSYRTATREQLLRHLAQMGGGLAPMDDEDLRHLVARVCAKSFLLRPRQQAVGAVTSVPPP